MFKIIRLYLDDLIIILAFALFLIIIYLIFSFAINYSLKITKHLNEKRKKVYLDRALIIIRGIKLIIRYLLFFIFIIFLLNKFNINLTVVLTSAGFLGATIILVFQNTLKDIFSGWLFFFEDIFREGEEIIINNTFKGKVVDFKSRFLVLRGWNGEIINLPYSQINVIHNFSRKRIIEKIVLKFKREILTSDFFDKLEELLKNNLEKYPNLEISLRRNFNLGETWFEIVLSLKIPISLREEVNYEIKTNLFKNFSDSLLEIKNEN
jgi:small conductance mechanosensitive channel